MEEQRCMEGQTDKSHASSVPLVLLSVAPVPIAIYLYYKGLPSGLFSSRGKTSGPLFLVTSQA